MSECVFRHEHDHCRPMVEIDGRQMTRARMIVAQRDGLDVDDHSWEAAHSCGHALCINPEHLRATTNEGNRDDRKAHGTWGWKLTEDEARMILTDPRSQRVLADELGVSKSLIGAIRRGECWPHLNDGGQCGT